MARGARFSDSLLQRIRRYFGLDQHEMAMWLGLTQPQLSRYESGDRAMPIEVDMDLEPWRVQLPAEPLTTPAYGPPQRGPLEARLNYCQHHARRLRWQLRPLEEQAVLAARLAAALPHLRAALPPDPGPEANPDPVTDWPGVLNQHRHRWLSHRRTTLLPGQSAQYQLWRLQAEALETEAAALRELLKTAVE
ncbi:XRE family transcriptional regulator [Hymenobacter gummosus]|uniref:XRE family transcriptional regulator n=1 Tax=Hymenobacter gummosus TaxID=1776032 RepID=A0A431TXW6_9BACT|nr:helix-turn-helix transcriptional regulator [Hymenobacter gummosus]RTQ46816.1 XRE family transcriptional regulator [Hymenobacter gummosus]